MEATAAAANLSAFCGTRRSLSASSTSHPFSKVSLCHGPSKGRIVLKSSRDQTHLVVKAIATPDIAVKLPLMAEGPEYVNKRIQSLQMDRTSSLDAVEPVCDANKDLEQNEENIEEIIKKVINKVKVDPYGSSGDHSGESGDIRIISIEENLIKIQLKGRATSRTWTERGKITEMVRALIPEIRAVQIFE